MSTSESDVDTKPRATKVRRTSVKNFIEMAKNLVEIAALIIGGWWALHTFLVKDKPGLEPHFDATTQLKWFPGPTPETCIADWHVDLKNIGGSAVEVGAVRAHVWTFPPLIPPPNGSAYVDLQALRPPEKDPSNIFDKRFDDGPLTGHYPPNQSSSHTFEWVVPKQTGKWVAFELDVFDDGKPQQKQLDYVYDWDSLCPPQTPPETNQPKS
jgi:hypothetical protein